MTHKNETWIVTDRQVELTNPSHILWSACRSRSNVGVVRPNSLSRSLPFEIDLLARKREGLRLVAGYCWSTAVSGDVEIDT